MMKAARLMLLGAATFAMPVAAQESKPPLAGLLDDLPPAEDAPQATPPAPNTPPLPIIRPPDPTLRPLAPPPTVEVGTVGTTELPPSAVTYDRDVAPPSAGASSADVAAAPVLLNVPPPPTEADIAWEARQEQQRQAINAVEAPIVARLNAAIVAEQEQRRARAEEMQAAYEQSLADREAAIRRSEAEHQAAMEAYRERVARERAAYEARVAACLDGLRDACAPR